MLNILAVPNTLTHFIRIYYEDYRRRKGTAYRNPSDGFPPASEIWEHFRMLLKGNLNWLKLALDTSRPNQVLVSSVPFQQKLVGDEQNITLIDIDPILSILAASYKLAKAHPSRFCQQQPHPPIEHIWGLHHEDWMRAYAVTTFSCARHIWFAFRFESNPDTTLFSAYMDFSHLTQKARDSESFGYITDELLQQVKMPEGPDRMTAMQQERGIIGMENLSRLATKDEIKYTINTLGLFQSRTAAERDCIIQDTGSALSEIITEAVCTTLGTIAPGTDLDEELNSCEVSSKMRQPPVTESEREALRVLLKSRVCRVQYDASKQTAVDDHRRHDGYQSIIDAGGATRPHKANEDISSSSIIDLEKLRNARAQIGENLPPNQDLASICSLRGIDVNTLSLNPYNAKYIGKVSHIIGMLFCPTVTILLGSISS